MSIQAKLGATEPPFPKVAKDDSGRVWLLVGIDRSAGRGHYLIHGSRLHRGVASVSPYLGDYTMETWVSDSTLADYLTERDLEPTEYAEWLSEKADESD